MANRLEISAEEWAAIYPILAAHAQVRMASTEACRAFLMAVLWVLRSGAQWRLLPAEFGHWNSVFKRFSRGCQHGVWPALHTGCAPLPDLQPILIDSTVIRAHPCAAGAAESSAAAEALGRSRGGFGTQIHAITDGLGNPLDCVLTGGQAHDATQGAALLALTPEGAEAFIGDKSDDSDALVQAIAARGMAAVIQGNRIKQLLVIPTVSVYKHHRC
jgi:transposase